MLNCISLSQVLNISNNELLYIQSMTLSTLPSVTHWDASYNNITYIMDNQFVYLGSAEYINLSHNKIDNIQKYSFSDLPELMVLDLSYNRIFDDEFFTGLASLSALNLSHNQFDAFDPTLLQTIGNVDLKHNPLGCSWLLSEIADNDFGNIRLGELIGNENAIGFTTQEIRCSDYDNDSPLRNTPVVRNIVVIRKLIKENFTQIERLEPILTDVSGVVSE